MTMNLTTYRRDLNAKKRELAALLRQRQGIDQKIAQLQPLIGHLEGLCIELGDRAAKETAAKVELTTGLTELARLTLEEAYIPLSPSELMKRMQSKGFDFSRYSNPLASIHVVLQRLVKSGQVKAVPQKGGKKAYQWITVIDGLLSILAKASKAAAQQALGKESEKQGPAKEATRQSGGAQPKR